MLTLWKSTRALSPFCLWNVSDLLLGWNKKSFLHIYIYNDHPVVGTGNWFWWLVVARRWNKEGLVFVPMRQQVGREGESLAQCKLVTRGRFLTGRFPLHLNVKKIALHLNAFQLAVSVWLENTGIGGGWKYHWWTEETEEIQSHLWRRQSRAIGCCSGFISWALPPGGHALHWIAMDSRLHHLCHQIVEWAKALYA